ncbi:MAG: ABC transporter substrate-binding protein [Rhodospirillales bacterium]|nr:ABC transporter substrate-binding protein [Rhodospirillales bacterium]
MTIRRRILPVLMALLLGAAGTARAASPTKLTVGYLSFIDTIVLFHAQHGGYFRHAGLAVRTLRVNDGPAVISAVLSGSAEIGLTAATPVAIAHEHGQKLSLFATSTYELWPPSPNLVTLVASKRSGITTLAGLKGRTIASNAQSSACMVAIAQHLARAGLTLKDVKVLIVPFPNMMAALALGEADAACTVVPFLTAMEDNPAVAPKVLARGTVAGLRRIRRLAVAGYFARPDWIAGHRAVLARFLGAMQAAQDDLDKHPARFNADLIKYFHMPAPFAAKVPFALSTSPTIARPADYQPLFDALHASGLLARALPAADVVTTISPAH